MNEHAVLIVGGGPTGLMLAGELSLAGVDVAILERRPSQEILGTRAGGFHARSIEVLDQRGIADRFLAEGKTMQIAGFGGVSLDISDFPTRHNYGLALTQNHIERILAEWAQERGVSVIRNVEVTGFTQDDTGVSVTLADGRTMRAHYLVGCDGGRSVIRKAAGIEFAGWDASVSNLIAEVEMTEEPKLGLHKNERGVMAMRRLEDGRVGVVLTEKEIGKGEPTLRDVSEALIDYFGTDFGVHNPGWISRFTDMARQAASYRKGRVLLAGDAAHVHYPAGGQGLNLGLQDAVNLGWKLALVVKGASPATLLDSYHSERHPVAARVLRNTMAAVALGRGDDRTAALGEVLADILTLEQPRKRMGGMMSGLDIHYDLGEGHPLLGRRMPDLDLQTASGMVRVYSLLHDAKPLLLNLGAPGAISKGRRVKLIDASYGGAWELPVLGTVAAPGAVLVRPDGYVAWVGDSGCAGLPEALAKWFGEA
ncbi:FAD-dependent monooxygenase [Massilia endophytica]|uniref:FAD-dependent monooxygenase n=1 Tax=Massilia endophytica TaxID=2899220 RepID=UPI001E4B067C|nr:FAD-dependent monooxygenase [Massilia endophytica]UGQ47419.1 FAD-dependent monooxygenase [Massilia endophytica]